MNDFTKEELILMYHNFSETEFRGTNEKLNTIRQKIQSMIDNYCVHVPEIKSNDDSPLFVGCQFCDKVFYDE